jgi:hypothetical protein
MIGDTHPQPGIIEILDQLGQLWYFTCLDIVTGYHHIELQEREGRKTAKAPIRGIGSTGDFPLG